MKITVCNGKAVIAFTEKTLKEIISAVTEHKNSTTNRNTVRVESDSQDIEFEIYCEADIQQSLGYRLVLEKPFSD